MQELMMEMPQCPVCGKPTVRGIGDNCHCGKARLLSSKQEHYLGFKTIPTEWPKKGCPICGRHMEEAGKFLSILSIYARASIGGKGLDRMLCNQNDHYCYVTKDWYIENKR